MSAAIPCTRATVQRVAFRAVQCKRYASTETVAIGTTAPPPAPIAPAKPAKRESRTLPEKKLDVSQRLHRALYPEQYREGYKPRLDKKTMDVRRKETTKPISEKWAPVMKQKSVEKKLSMLVLLCSP
jgi:hypothetical protein